MHLPVQLPKELQPFAEQFSQKKLPCARAVAGKISPSAKRWQSKVGGEPYLPKGVDWPCRASGERLFFLVQINFAEVPRLASFPEKGLLQFFVADDDLYGMDFDDGENQDGFRVLWYPEVVENQAVLQSKFDLELDFECLPHHPDECYSLRFSLAEELAPVCDYRFFEAFGQDFFQQFGTRDGEVQEAWAKANKCEGHKVGGYAYFTQDDPRSAADPMLLLFQLDSDEGMDLMWGDMGVGHFFIRESDLLARNFERVLFDWDSL